MSTALAAPAPIAVPLSIRLYGDIINRQRPVHQNDLFSRKHPKMSRLNRAKLFAPFAALDGFEGRVRNKAIPYVRRHELDPDEIWELNRRLNILHGLTLNGKQARANRVRVRVEYFEKCTDPDSDAFGVKGLYHTADGFVQCVDCVSQTLVLNKEDDNGAYVCRAISFSDIYTICDPTDQLFLVETKSEEWE